MSASDASITLKWANGTHVFRLGWGELITLQEECNAGPFEVMARLGNGRWRMQDISVTIRLALIGGGLSVADALQLVETYVEKRPPMENVVFARGILGVGLQGNPDEPVGKFGAAPETTETEQPTA